MADDEIKVLVKKPDGSFVHVPLSEVQKRSRPAAPVQPAQSAVKTSDVPPNLPVAHVEPVKEEKKPVVQQPVRREEKKVEQQRPAPQDVKKENNQPKFDKKESDRLEKEIPAVVQETKKPVVKPVVQAQMTQKPQAKIEPPKKAVPAPVVKVEKNDLGSLLEEELPAISKFAPLTSESREKQVDEILKSISFKIPAGNNSRVRTIVQMFLKEIRSEAETLEILRRPEIEGGVGLSDDQSKEVVQKTRRTTITATSPATAMPLKSIPKQPVVFQTEPKKPVEQKVNDKMSENTRLEKEIPAIIQKNVIPKPAAPAVQNPVPPVKPVVDSKKLLQEQVTRATLAEVPVDTFRLNSERTKTIMQDVKSASPVQMGPVDEIRYFSLVDFRRLSNNPDDAAGKLKQKFLNLREESIILFFEALEAWKISPLYHDYIKTVSDSVVKRTPLARLAADKEKITMQEIYALVKMEKELG